MTLFYYSLAALFALLSLVQAILIILDMRNISRVARRIDRVAAENNRAYELLYDLYEQEKRKNSELKREMEGVE
ncbi:MAG: hypothetical protein Q4C04_04360 [Clostridia bacterium]|nr:hypothetical protein [Clostridia bacterium]